MALLSQFAYMKNHIKSYKIFLKNQGIPIVSEENSQLQIELQRYWLVDPLDGQQHPAKNNEFTINIALLDNNKPSTWSLLSSE